MLQDKSDTESDAMVTKSPGDVTSILEKIAAGDEVAKNELFECVYDELHEMAHRRMKNERVGHTLGATGLVHEVYIRLSGQALEKGRAYFFGAAARAMYQILVEYARKRRRHDEKRIFLDVALNELEGTNRVNMLDLHKALEELKEFGEQGERWHAVIVMRFFGGLEWKEIVENIGGSISRAEKDGQAARAWLFGRLRERNET